MTDEKRNTIKAVDITAGIHEQKGLVLSADFGEGVEVAVVRGELVFRFAKTTNETFSSPVSSHAKIAFSKAEVTILANLLLVYNKHTHEGGDLQSLLEEHFFDS